MWRHRRAIGAISRELTAGEEIRVATADHKTFRGKFQSATEESLTIAESAGQEMLVRGSVMAVSLKGNGHRKRNMLIGLGAGVAGGLIIGAVADSSCNRNVFLGCFLGPNFGKEVFTPLGTVVGVGVGALIPTGGWREIYRSR